MRNRPRTINYSLLVALFAVTNAVASEPNDSGAGKVCGVLRNFQGVLQVFDSSRTHLGEASFGTKLRCGDWVGVDAGKATIEHAGGASLLVAENTFFQILDPQSGMNPEHAHIALYRGEFVLQATSKHAVTVVTPNSVARIVKGGAFIVFSSESEETQIVGLGGQATLENRFFGQKKMTTDFAKFVAFSNPVERIVPEEARWVNARDLNERLAKIGVEAALRDALEKAVKAGSKTKMPVSLAVARPVIVEGRGEFVAATGAALPETVSGHAPAARVSRAPASLPTKKAGVPVRRGPRKVEMEPNFALKRPETEAQERKKLIQALSGIRPEDEE